MIPPDLLLAAAKLLQAEGRLIELPPGREVVFVGDTHGDREAAETVLSRFLTDDRVLVFLGDYVDRGPDSEGNLRLLLETKLRFPDRLALLMGNHEAYPARPFSPADFWDELMPAELQALGTTLSLLPFAALSERGLLAVHGALPDLPNVEAIREVLLGSRAWRSMTWGDYVDQPDAGAPESPRGRPAYGRNSFASLSRRLGVHVLVRSHQPSAPTYLFGDRCLTLFTSRAYGSGRPRVALLRPEGEVHSARELELVEV